MYRHVLCRCDMMLCSQERTEPRLLWEVEDNQPFWPAACWSVHLSTNPTAKCPVALSLPGSGTWVQSTSCAKWSLMCFRGGGGAGSLRNENVALMSCHDTTESQKEPTLWMILEMFGGDPGVMMIYLPLASIQFWLFMCFKKYWKLYFHVAVLHPHSHPALPSPPRCSSLNLHSSLPCRGGDRRGVCHSDLH